MKSPILAAVASLFLTGAALGAEIAGSAFNSGNWEGAAYTFDESGEFSHCAISVGYVNGDYLYLSVNSDATVTVGIESHSFRFRPDESFPVSLRIDNRRPFNGTATALEETFIVVTIQDFQGAMRALTQGRGLRVEGRTQLGNFDLTGSFRALEAARSCAIDQLDFAARGGVPKTLAPSEPAAPPAPDTAAAPPATDRTMLFQIATEMISEIGVPRFRYLDASESRDIAGQESVFWVSEETGVLGGVVILALDGASLRDSDPGDLSFVSADCLGDVATTTRSMTLEGLEAREIRALCVEAEGTVETILTKIRVDDLALYTILAFGEGAASDSSQARRQISEAVALRAASYVAGSPATGGKARQAEP